MNKAIPELLNLANGSAAAGDTVARQVCVVAIDEIESLQAERDMFNKTSTHWWREWHAANGRPRPTATDAGVNEACKRMDAQEKKIEQLNRTILASSEREMRYVRNVGDEIDGYKAKIVSLQAEVKAADYAIEHMSCKFRIVSEEEASLRAVDAYNAAVMAARKESEE